MKDKQAEWTDYMFTSGDFGICAILKSDFKSGKPITDKLIPIKSFIHQTLQQERQRIIGIVKGWENEVEEERDKFWGKSEPEIAYQAYKHIFAIQLINLINGEKE